MRQLKDFTFRFVAGANIVTVALMLLVGYSDRIDAGAHPIVGLAGLTFPFFLAANIVFFAFWLCMRPRWAAIPVLGFLLGYGPVMTYCPVNHSRTVPDGALKVLSYNVFNFQGWDAGHPDGEIARYLLRQDADVVCLQESGLTPWQREQLEQLMASRYAWRDTSKCPACNGDEMALLSKMPIVRKEHVPYPSQSNHSCAWWLRTAQGDTIVVVNNHLESTALSPELKEGFKTMVKGDLHGDSAKAESRALVAKLADATARRAPQARAVAQYVREHSRYPIVLCGDFNDSPISYARRTIAAPLTDCFTETGNGPGISYHGNAFFVRIDNIMCSSHFTPYDCRVDRTIAASDHYPIVCRMKREK